MYLVLFFLSSMLVCAQYQDVVISRMERQTHILRLIARSGDQLTHDALFINVRTTKHGADSSFTPIAEINNLSHRVEVAGRTSDSNGIILALTRPSDPRPKEYSNTRHVVLRIGSDRTYHLADVDGRIMESLSDIVQGARMVHRGENSLPISNLPKLNLTTAPYSQTLSVAAFAVSGVERLTPMWQLSQSGNGAENILTYGFDDESQPTVQVVRIGAGPLRRLIVQRGVIVGLTSWGSSSPTVRVFDESSDSARYARVIRYEWNENDLTTDGHYVPDMMTILSTCVIPPKRFAPFPLSARLTKPVRLGFAPGAEGCTSSRHDVYSWPFAKPIDAETPCEILATAKDAADVSWHFIGVRVSNDPAVRRLFGDHGTSESAHILTGGWAPASSLEVTGIPGVAAKP